MLILIYYLSVDGKKPPMNLVLQKQLEEKAVTAAKVAVKTATTTVGVSKPTHVSRM